MSRETGARRARLIAVVALGAFFFTTSPAVADQAPIVIDGEFGDWSGVPVAHSDPLGDGGASGVDFGRLWIADDARFLFLRFELGIELPLDEGANNLVLYLDTDASAATGLAVGGLGAELVWRFSDRNGTFHFLGQTTVFHDDIRFRGEPTVSAPEYEVAIGRDTLPDGLHSLFSGTTVRVLIRDTASGGDSLPGVGTLVSYTLDGAPLVPESPIPLSRESPQDLRLVTHNVLNSGPFDPAKEARFGRQWAAVAADIYNFQEMGGHSAIETATLVTTWVPLPGGQAWTAAKNSDCITASRYPISQTWNLAGNLAALIDTSSVLGTPLLVINAHLPCCSNESGRQGEIDQILAFLRDARTPGGTITLAAGTPFLITGDFNLVVGSQPLRSLLTGDIVDEVTHGPDFQPDWDGSALMKVESRQTEKRMGYTWRDDNQSFWPGHLDYVVTSDSVLARGRDFILYTPEMSAASLATYGLQASDSLASDHMILCTDLRAPGVMFARGDCNGDGTQDISDPITLLQLLFGGGGVAPCEDACDSNDDGAVNVADVSHHLGAVFGTGPVPDAPFPACGPDPTADLIECLTVPACP